MKRFAEIWPEDTIWQTASAKLPWSHNVVLMEKIKGGADERRWYAQRAVEAGWSVVVLEHQIALNLFERQGRASSNFQQTLPAPTSDLAHGLLKDPYSFDFLTLGDDARERELEQGLIAHMQKFLVELGAGFAFVGRQFHLDVAGDDFYPDLLFYHTRLHCYVVIDLKVVKFEPEFAEDAVLRRRPR